MSRVLVPIAVLATLALPACSSGEQGFGNTEDNSNVDEGTALLEYSPLELIIEDVDYDQQISSSGIFTIDSVGDGVLRLYDVALANTGGGVLYMTPYDDDINLAAGVSRDFTVVATLSEYGKVEGSVRIQSNDGDQQLIEIPITVLPVGWVDEAEDSGR
jgi:hypothetical protein